MLEERGKVDHLVGIVSRKKDVEVEDSGDNEDEPSMEVLMMMKTCSSLVLMVGSVLSWLVWFG